MACYFDVKLLVANALLRFLKILQFEKYVIVDAGSKRFAAKLKVQKQPPEEFYGKKLFLKISQNSQENTCARVFFNKAAGLEHLFYRTRMDNCFSVRRDFPRILALFRKSSCT